MTNHYQQPDGTPKATGRTLHDSIAHVRIADSPARSDYTIHVEHPGHDRGVRCFFRTDREMVVSGIRKHLRRLADEHDGLTRIDVVDAVGLGLGEVELLPDSFTRTGAFAPETPAVAVMTE